MNDNEKEISPEELLTKSDFVEPEILVGDLPEMTTVAAPISGGM